MPEQRAIVLREGFLLDGSGAPGYFGDVLLAAGRIAAIGLFDTPHEALEIDCRGFAVCPGFIDAHSHSDLQVLTNRTEKLRQGVTAEVVGNCGFSPYPASTHPHELHQFANGIFCGDQSWGWPSSRAYLADLNQQALNATVSSLAGHGSLRIAAVGMKMGALSATELDRLSGLLIDSVSGGAVGFSTGLMYAPGSSAPFDELEALCHIVSRSGKIYCSHIRDYSFHLSEAVDEQLELARRTGCRLQISHLQCVGQMNWPNQARVLEKIEAARAEGIDVEFDCYPYLAGSTVLTQLLPQWSLEGGAEGLLERLADPLQRRTIQSETLKNLPHRWDDILISALVTARNRHFIGSTLAEIAAARNEEPIDTLINLLMEEHGAVNMTSFNQSEDNLRATLTHRLATVISDGFYVKGRPHPRLYGTFPRLLGTIVREKRWMTLEEAVHKVTGKPAGRFGFKDRGLLRPGFHADMVIFDPKTIDSPATFTDPELPPVGIRAVIRNGQPAWSAESLNLQ